MLTTNNNIIYIIHNVRILFDKYIIHQFIAQFRVTVCTGQGISIIYYVGRIVYSEARWHSHTIHEYTLYDCLCYNVLFLNIN